MASSPAARCPLSGAGTGWMRWSMTCQAKTPQPGQQLAFSANQRERELVRWKSSVGRLLRVAGVHDRWGRLLYAAAVQLAVCSITNVSAAVPAGTGVQ